jgi:hypothetical protein
MKKHLLLILFFLILQNFYCEAQTHKLFTDEQKAKHEEKIKNKLGKDWQFSYHEETNSLKRMRGTFKLKGRISDEQDAVQSAETVFNSIADVVAIPLENFVIKNASYDGYLDRYKIIFQQFYKGIEVEDARIYISIKSNGELYNISNSTHPNLNVDNNSSIYEEEAIQTIYIQYENLNLNEQRPSINLTIIPAGSWNFITVDKLCYKIVFYSYTFFVDAMNKNIVYKYPNFKSTIYEKSIQSPEVSEIEYSSPVIYNYENFKTLNADAVTLENTYYGTISGEIYPLDNPEGSVHKTGFEGVYIWFDKNVFDVLPDTKTIPNGSYIYPSNNQVSNFRTILESDKIVVKNDQGSALEQKYIYDPNQTSYNFTFLDSISPGHEANVYYNLTEQLKWFDIEYANHPTWDKLTAYTNSVDPFKIGTSLGICYKNEIYYKPSTGKCAWIIRHEASHFFVRQLKGSFLNNKGKVGDAMDEAFAWFYPCSSMNTSKIITYKGNWEIDDKDDLEYTYPVKDFVTINQDGSVTDGTDGIVNEADHSHYNNQKAIASAWWEIKKSISVDFNQLLYSALDQLSFFNLSVTPRDFFNTLLDVLYVDANPSSLGSDFQIINDAYTKRKMYYYPKIQITNSKLEEKSQFVLNEHIYAEFSNCPTYENLRVYIVAHKDVWKDKDILTDITGVEGGFQNFYVGSDGTTYNLPIWLGGNKNAGDYDVIVDVNNNGKYDFDFDGRIDGKSTFKIVLPSISISNVQLNKSSYNPGESAIATITLGNSLTGANVLFICDSHTAPCIEVGNGVYSYSFNVPSNPGAYPVTVVASKTGYIDATPFQTSLTVKDITDLYNGNISPAGGNTATNFQFSVYFSDTQAPQYVKVIGNGWSQTLTGSGTNYSTGVQFAGNKIFSSPANYSYHFEALTQSGRTLRFPDFDELYINVGQSAVGWDLSVNSIGTYYSPASVKPGTVITVIARIQNLSNSGNTYYNVPLKVELLDPAGNKISEDSENINELASGSLNDYTLEVKMPIDATEGYYQIIIKVLTTVDNISSNNSISLSVVIGSSATNEQYEVPTSSQVMYINDHVHIPLKVNNQDGPIYTLQGIYSGSPGTYVKIKAPDGSFSNIYEEHNKLWTSNGATIAMETIDIANGLIQMKPGQVGEPGPVFTYSSISGFPGQTVSFEATAPSGKTFVSSNKSDYPIFKPGTTNELNVVKSWITSASRSLNNTKILFSFSIPPTITSGNDYIFYLTTPYSGISQEHLTRLEIKVINPVPLISSLNKYTFSADDQITISGSNFGTTPGTVKFYNNLTGINISWKNTEIVCKVPYGVESGNVVIINNSVSSNGVSYTVNSSTGDPFVVSPIPDQSLEQNSSIIAATLSNVFSDPNNDPLIFSATSSSINITPTISNGILTITSNNKASGSYTITVSATDLDNVTVLDIFTVNIINPVPLIEVTPGLLSTFGNIEIGTASLPQTYSISGFNLTGEVTVLAPDGYQVSLNSSTGYANTLILPQSSGTISGITIYVKFIPTLAGEHSYSISNSSTGAITQIVAVSGTGYAVPAINLSNATLSFGNVTANTNSVPQSYNISGTNLTEDITITAPNGFKISLDENNEFNSSLKLTQNNGIVPNTIVYVMFSPTSVCKLPQKQYVLKVDKSV